MREAHKTQGAGLLERLGLNRDQVSRAFGVASVKKTACRKNPTSTHYLDGEEQRAKKRLLHANHTWIVAAAIQGAAHSVLAHVHGVTETAIRTRTKPFMALVFRSGKPVDGDVAKKKWLIVEVNDQDAKV